MRRTGALLGLAKAHMQQIRAAIGKALRERYDLAQPLPDHIVRAMKKIEKAEQEEPAQRDRRSDETDADK